MATEIHFVIAWGALLILIWVIGAILILVGQIKGSVVLRSVGFVVLGLAAFVTPTIVYMDKVGNSWERYVMESGDIVMLGVLAFVGGLSTAVGILTYREHCETQRDS